MNKNRTCPRLLALIAGSLMCAGLGTQSQAQTTNYIVDQFDTDTTGEFWNNGWGTASPVVSWSTNNAITSLVPNNPGSGSAEWMIAWTTTGDQFEETMSFHNGVTLNLFNFTNVSFDIKFDPACATDGNGSYGDVEMDVIPSSAGWPSTALGVYGSSVANGNGWIHVNLPIVTAGNTALDSVYGIGLKMQQNKTGANITGTTIFYLDNIIFTGSLAPTPPPQMTITPAGKIPAGLLMVPGETGGDWTRELLATLNNQYSWVGSPTPVTYSTTITNYPGAQYAGFNSVIFLVAPGTYADPALDYDDPTAAQLTVVNNANGTATAQFQYKTNLAGSNPLPSCDLGTITAPSILGTWSLTFNSDTNVTLTCPNGTSTNVYLPDEATAQMFANPLKVYFGCEQGGPGNATAPGAVYSEFKVTGVNPAIDDTFTEAALDTTNTWVLDGASDQNIILLPSVAGDQYWVRWTLPATGFGLQFATNLNQVGGFQDPGVNHTVATTTAASVLVPGMTANVSSPNTAFFNLIKRTATQLQVLLPGETNAPGTATGKTGTPTPEGVYGLFSVTVNACDATWHIVSSTDTVDLSTATDPTGGYVGATGTLAGGTAQIEWYFGTAGSQTVTATDTSNTNIKSNTSSTVTVQ